MTPGSVLLLLCVIPVQLQWSKHQLIQNLPFHLPTLPSSRGLQLCCHKDIALDGENLLKVTNICFSDGILNGRKAERLELVPSNGSEVPADRCAVAVLQQQLLSMLKPELCPQKSPSLPRQELNTCWLE